MSPLPLFFLLLTLVFGALLISFSETRTPVGLFLFFGILGIMGAWIFTRAICILLVNQGKFSRLINLSPKTGKIIYIHFIALTFALYLFVLLDLVTSLLEYESEARRLVKWIVEVAIFGIILSLSRKRWIAELPLGKHQKALALLIKGIRLFTLTVLILILGLDGMGYTNFSDYLADASLKSLGMIPLLIFLKKGFVEWIDNKLFAQGLSRFKINADLLTKWKKTLRQWTGVIIWLLFILGMTSIWDIQPEFTRLLQKILSLGFTLGGVRVTLGLALSILLTFYVSVLLSRLIRALLERNLYPRKNWDAGIRNAMSTGLHYLMILLGLLFALRLLGFDIRNITVLAGAFGVGLGFGLQNLANNFASGIVLLIERPIKVGDIIQVSGLTGKVKKIGARSTSVETIDQATILIPNGEILSAQVTNWTYGNSVAGLSIPVGVAYGTDVEKVRKLLMEAAQNHPGVLKRPSPQVEFKSFGESSLDFVLRIWIHDVEDRRNVQTDLMVAIEKTLRENKIEIPYPHREIFLHTKP